MPDTNTAQPMARNANSDRRQPDSAMVHTWEVLDATEAELMAANAKLASANQALDAARQREDRLLSIIEKGQIRQHRILLGTAITALLIVLLSLVVAFILR